MSIPLSDGRKARFRLEPVPHEQRDEEDLMLAGLAELGEVYEENDWDEEFKDEEQYIQTCSREGSEHENI